MLQSMMHSRSESPRETPRGQLNLYEDSVEGATGHSPAIGTSSPIARTPSLSSRGLDSPVASPDMLTTLGGGVSAADSTASPSRGVSSGDPKESEILGMANGSDEMLMTLLAGQAAMDCENLPIKGWEEVDGWKKAGLLLPTERRAESLRNCRSCRRASRLWYLDINAKSRLLPLRGLCRNSILETNGALPVNQLCVH